MLITNLGFKHYWEKRRLEVPDEPNYLSICSILAESESDEFTIEDIFDEYMVESEDYDKKERGEMLLYLYKISKPYEE